MREFHLLAKPLDQITAEDIADLCANGGSHESLTLEFKRELQGRDGQPDPWTAGGDYRPFARDQLFREITAFANAQGGTLVLGIAELGGNPPRAGSITPLPRVSDLAPRLADAARACIDPPLGGLQVRAIVTDEDAGSGVVLFRTLASPYGPHRVASDGHAFVRRGTSSVKMTMREIQDLTLDLARGADRLDALFRQRADAFAGWLRQGTSGQVNGIRLTAVPLGILPAALRLARDADGQYFQDRFPAKFEGSEEEHVLLAPLRGATTRPILRGCRAAHVDDGAFAVHLEMLDRGIVDLWWWRTPDKDAPSLYLGWILGSVVLVLNLVNWIRELAGASEWEYAFELEVAGLGPPAGRNPVESVRVLRMGDFADTINVEAGRFPRLSLRSSSEDAEILNLLMSDVLDAGGVRRPSPRITVLDTPLTK